MPEEKTEMEKRNILRLSNEESNRLTRECLETALIRLMAEKDFDKISITELAAKAGVSRTAFYTNFTSKEEILGAWFSSFFDQLTDLAAENIARGSTSEVFVFLFDWIRRNKRDVTVLLKANMQEVMFSRMEKGILNKLGLSDMKTTYAVAAFCGALGHLVFCWTENGLRETSEEMAVLCEEIFSNYISRIQNG